MFETRVDVKKLGFSRSFAASKIYRRIVVYFSMPFRTLLRVFKRLRNRPHFAVFHRKFRFAVSLRSIVGRRPIVARNILRDATRCDAAVALNRCHVPREIFNQNTS